MQLTDNERERYQKHLLLPEIGEEGQVRLKTARVLVVGAGGLGSPVLLYLAAAGVGRIRIVDSDMIDLSNLQRQVMHDTPGIGTPKVDSALQRLHDLNPEIEVEIHNERFAQSNAGELVRGCTGIADCTDNMETRFLINSTCVKSGLPYVFGAVFRYEGQVSVFDATRGPCFQCMYPVIPSGDALPDPKRHGLLGTVPGVIGMLQATEILKLILGIGKPLIGKLMLYDALDASFKTVNIPKRSQCPVCGIEE